LLRGIEPAVVDYEHLRDVAFQSRRASVWLLAVVNLVVATITGIGIASLTGYWIAQRTRQIGVRRALGATRGDILGYFLTENFLISLGGVVAGTVLAMGLSLWLVMRFETQRLSLLYVLAGVVLLLLLGQCATLAPAMRASRVPPVEATRTV
jgi:putative ABC transport system permease protein